MAKYSVYLEASYRLSVVNSNVKEGLNISLIGESEPKVHYFKNGDLKAFFALKKDTNLLLNIQDPKASDFEIIYNPYCYDEGIGGQIWDDIKSFKGTFKDLHNIISLLWDKFIAKYGDEFYEQY